MLELISLKFTYKESTISGGAELPSGRARRTIAAAKSDQTACLCPRVQRGGQAPFGAARRAHRKLSYCKDKDSCAKKRLKILNGDDSARFVS